MPKKKLYRSNYGILAGVCKGIADYLGLPVALVRALTFILFLFTGFFPVGIIYLILAFALPLNPDEKAFYAGHRYYGGSSPEDEGFFAKPHHDDGYTGGETIEGKWETVDDDVDETNARNKG